MRDPNRIKPFLETLEKAWKKVPDWRFGQLMVNFLGSLDKDPFFPEDNEMQQKIIDFFNLDEEDKKKRE
jgi:hypothetical protein